MRRLGVVLLAMMLALAVPGPWSVAASSTVRPSTPIEQARSESGVPDRSALAVPAVVASVPSWGVSLLHAACVAQQAPIERPAQAAVLPARGRTCYTVPPQSRRFPLLI